MGYFTAILLSGLSGFRKRRNRQIKSPDKRGLIRTQKAVEKVMHTKPVGKVMAAFAIEHPPLAVPIVRRIEADDRPRTACAR